MLPDTQDDGLFAARVANTAPRLLNGRYELGEVIGTGGMGTVRKAFDTRLDRRVAIKILRGDRVGDGVARARMEAEARLAAGLDHPNIASVYDYDEDQTGEHRDPFIVMQYVEGVTLGALLQQDGVLPEEQVRSILAGLADALSAAHTAGVVHRDIKPSNILISPDGRPVLVDFGIATSASIDPITETGVIVGTMEYLSPEQARGLPATAGSDVYSLGVVAAQCLTGESPFKRETAIATAMSQVSDDLPALPPTVPSGLARLVRSMVEKDPARRPTAREVAESSRSSVTLDDLRRRAPGLFARVRSHRHRVRSMTFAGVGLIALLLATGVITRVLPNGSDRVMPDVVGQSIAQAAPRLEKAGATVRERKVDRPTAESGVVVGQSIDAGDPLPSDAVVTLDVATGRMNVEASKVEGRSLSSARERLEGLGFVVAVDEIASVKPAGTVIALDHSGRLPIGTTITLTVARTPQITGSTVQRGTSGTTTKSSGSKGNSNKGPGNNNGKKKQ